MSVAPRRTYTVHSATDLPNFRAPDPSLPEAWAPYWKSFVRALRAIARSERTLKAYGDALEDLADFLEPAPRLERVSREQLERFFAAMHERGARPAYVAIHFRGLRRWFNWLVEEGELEASPMRRLRAPHVPDEPVPVLELEQLRRLLKACEGQGFEERRDLALLRFLIDTGVRLGGVAGMKVGDVDLDAQTAVIRAKGGDIYMVDLGAKAVRDIDRYLRVRQRHVQHELPQLWLGLRGALTADGIYQMVRRRSEQAKIPVNKAVHVFRHSFSHHFRVAGGDRDDLKELGGWKSDAMVSRYGRALAAARARQAHRRFSPGDQV